MSVYVLTNLIFGSEKNALFQARSKFAEYLHASGEEYAN